MSGLNRLAGAARRELTGGPMKVKGFPLLLAGQFTSSVGDLCYAVALPWLILSGGDGPAVLGSVLAAYGLSRVAGIPAGGLLADRIGPRRLMLLTDVVRFLVVGLLAAMVFAGTTPVWILVAIAVLVGASEGLFLPASFALLPSLLDDEDIGAGNALSSVATQFGGLLGPVLGGVLVAVAGPGPALLLDALTFAVSALTLIGVRTRDTAAGDEQVAAGSAGVSFRQVLRHGRLLHVVLMVGLVGNLVFAGAAEVALPTLAHNDFGASGYGILLGCLGAGMIAGAVVARRSRDDVRPGVVIVCLGLVMAVSIGTVAVTDTLAGAVLSLTVFAVANSWVNIRVMTMLQLWTPRHVLARVMSVLMLATTGTFPVSVAVAGLGVDRFGVAAFFPVAGLAIAIGVLGALTQRAFRDYRPGDRFAWAPSGARAPVPATQEGK